MKNTNNFNKNTIETDQNKMDLLASLRLPLIIAGGAGLLIGGLALWMYQNSRRQANLDFLQEEPLANGNAQGRSAAPAVHPTEHLEEDEEWNRADEASWESFPASDAPSSHSITRSSQVRH
jgi:hypothetical protein